MFTKYCSSITLIIFSLLIFQSCIAKESEERHTYIIDNQSSFELRYKVEIDSELTDINIAIGSDDEIYSEVVLAGGLGTPNQHFNITAGYINSDIFLTRDSLGIEIEALKLNSDLDLNWIPKNSDSEVTFTLTVTDDMLQ